MRSKTSLLLLFVLSLLPNWLQAEPIQGLGLHLSVGDLQISDSSTEQNHAESYAYGGIIDYQWTASNYFSVRLFGGEHIGSAQQVKQAQLQLLQDRLVWAGSPCVGWFFMVFGGSGWPSLLDLDRINGELYENRLDQPKWLRCGL